MSDDIGLQRAIWASLQQPCFAFPSASAAPRPRPAARPGSFASGFAAPASRPQHHVVPRARDIKPTIPAKREDVAERRRAGQQSAQLQRHNSGSAGTPSRPQPMQQAALGDTPNAAGIGERSHTNGATPGALPPVSRRLAPVPSRGGDSSLPPAAAQQRAKPAGAPATAATDAQKGGTGTYPPHIDAAFADRIEAEIIDHGTNVTWDDVVGLEDAKQLLNEAVLLPVLAPEIFKGTITPWKGVLLFGPPGTGKTSLAKAVATSANTTFFNISASVLLSRYHGESEKMVKTLFQLARHHAPSTVFFDEIDAIMSQRGGSSEHEVARRVKSEILQQIDGVSSACGDPAQRVLVLAATNNPWDLDEAMRRRLEKRVFVPLPDAAGRAMQIRKFLSGTAVAPSVDPDAIATACEGFTGSDIHGLCRAAVLMRFRRLMTNKSPQELQEMRQRGELDAATSGEVTSEDFEEARKAMKPCVDPALAEKHKEWFETFGVT